MNRIAVSIVAVGALLIFTYQNCTGGFSTAEHAALQQIGASQLSQNANSPTPVPIPAAPTPTPAPTPQIMADWPFTRVELKAIYPPGNPPQYDGYLISLFFYMKPPFVNGNEPDPAKLAISRANFELVQKNTSVEFEEGARPISILDYQDTSKGWVTNAVAIEPPEGFQMWGIHVYKKGTYKVKWYYKNVLIYEHMVTIP